MAVDSMRGSVLSCDVPVIGGALDFTIWHLLLHFT